MKKTLVTAALAAASVLALNAPAMVGAATPEINRNGLEGTSHATFSVDPGDNAGNTGSLQLVAVPNLDFGSTSLSGLMAATPMSLGTKTRVHIGTDITNPPYDTSKAPGDILVKDYRTGTTPGAGEGWKLNAKVSRFTIDEAGNAPEISGKITLSLVNATKIVGLLDGDIHNESNGMDITSPKTVEIVAPDSGDSADTLVLDAGLDQGQGATGVDLNDTGNSFTPDANRNATAGNYVADITWTLSANP